MRSSGGSGLLAGATSDRLASVVSTQVVDKLNNLLRTVGLEEESEDTGDLSGLAALSDPKSQSASLVRSTRSRDDLSHGELMTRNFPRTSASEVLHS